MWRRTVRSGEYLTPCFILHGHCRCPNLPDEGDTEIQTKSVESSQTQFYLPADRRIPVVPDEFPEALRQALFFHSVDKFTPALGKALCPRATDVVLVRTWLTVHVHINISCSCRPVCLYPFDRVISHLSRNGHIILCTRCHLALLCCPLASVLYSTNPNCH